MGNLPSDLAMALDPVAFSVAAGIVPHPWQAEVLRSTAPRILLNCPRQSGKCSTVATLACHTALYSPGSLTLIVSPAERQSKELFRKALACYQGLSRPVPPHAEKRVAARTGVRQPHHRLAGEGRHHPGLQRRRVDPD